MSNKLSSLDQKTKKKLTILAVFVSICGIAISSLFVGKNPEKHLKAGELFGKKYTVDQFLKAYEKKRAQSKLRFGRAFETFEKLFNFEEETWDHLILLEEANQRKIDVDNQDVIDTISGYEFFYRQDKFDKVLYSNIVQQTLETIPRNFEESVRESLILEKLFDQVTAEVIFTDEEIIQEYKKDFNEMKVSYTNVYSDDFISNIQVSDSEINEHYRKQREDFRIPPTIKVEYIRMDYPKDGGIQKEVETKFKARAIVRDYPENSDMYALARKQRFEAKESPFFSKQDPDMDPGWPMDVMLEAFKMPINEISDPIERKDEGYLVYRVIEKKESYLPELSEVRQDVKDAVIKIKAKEKAREEAKAIAAKIKSTIETNEEITTFKQAADKLVLVAQESALVPQRQLWNIIRVDEAGQKTIINQRENKDLFVASSRDGYFVLKIEEIKDYDQTKFEEEKDSFKETLLQREKDKIYNSFVEKIKEKADLKTYPENYLKIIKEKYKKEEPIPQY